MAAPDVYGPHNSPWGVFVGPLPLDVVLAVMFAVLVGLARSLLSKTVLSWIANARLDGSRQNSGVLRAKFFECSYKTVHYVAAFTWECFILYPTNWYLETANLWKHLPQAMSLSFYLFYMYQCGFYLYSLFAVLFLDVRRRDWYQLITHHIVTLYLIIYSWQWGFVRIGLLILILLDTSDIFLEGAKCFNYIGLSAITNISFVLLVVTFFVCRIVLYPYICLWSTLFEAEVLIAEQGIEYGWWEKPLFNGLLIVLYVLQLYWFKMLLKVLFNTIIHGRVRDNREDGPQNNED